MIVDVVLSEVELQVLDTFTAIYKKKDTLDSEAVYSIFREIQFYFLKLNIFLKNLAQLIERLPFKLAIRKIKSEVAYWFPNKFIYCLA
jgi:hypothetical protein